MTLILAANIKTINHYNRRWVLILPSAVFRPWGLDLIKAANKLDAVSSVMMTNTKNVISDQREVQFCSVATEVVVILDDKQKYILI